MNNAPTFRPTRAAQGGQWRHFGDRDHYIAHSEIGATRSALTALARWAYPCGSVLNEGEWRRARHDDLVDMDAEELRRELARCRFRLAWEDPREWDYAWLLERERRIIAALRERARTAPPPAPRGDVQPVAQRIATQRNTGVALLWRRGGVA